jgi:hypothetical protein
MAKLEFYTDLAQKEKSFNTADQQFFQIDQAWEFIDWYNEMSAIIQADPFQNFFRGQNEARFKLYNSAQRYWTSNNLMQLESLKQPISYIEMLQNMVNNAKQNKLLQQVFKYYEIENHQMDMPLLSILQHYGAPTPLMDWTYDLDVALFFAIDKAKGNEESNIRDYVSIYRINKHEHSNFVLNNLNFISANIFPSVKNLSNYLGNNRVVYISDFEISADHDNKENRKIKPLTTYYNLNILAQKGIFIFNPHQSSPLEEIGLDPNKPDPGADTRIHCYNISKDLIELIKLKIGQNKIDEAFIYPDLKKYAGAILNDYLQWVVNS